MSAIDFINDLIEKGLQIWLDKDQLHYKGPKQLLTDDVINFFRNNKNEIVEYLKDSHKEKGLNLSYGQRALWFIDQTQPGMSAYNIPAGIRINGELDVRLLEKCINEIVKRHSVLRSTYSNTDGHPILNITPELKLNLPIVDLENLSESKKETELNRIIHENARTPFNLNGEVLVRIQLIRLSKLENILVLCFHHSVCDGWSINVFNKELVTLYKSFLLGRNSTLPELSMQYYEYAVWQQQMLKSKAFENQLSYWKNKLGGSLPVIDLPFDHPRPEFRTYIGAREYFVLPIGINSKLKELSKQEGVTLFMTLLTMFSILLHRYTSQRDILIGVPTAGRNKAEFEEMIGFFINTVVVRIDLNGNPSFLELLKSVKKITIEAYSNQDVPLYKLVEEIQPERSANYNPLFQVAFNLLSYSKDELEIPNLTLKPFQLHSVDAQFDLALNLEEVADGLGVEFSYNTDLFESSSVKKMIERFKVLVENIVSNKLTPINDLKIDRDIKLPAVIANKHKEQDTVKKFPLSYHQERLWFIDQFEKGYLYEASPIYHNIPLILYIKGKTDLKLLELSLIDLFHRHQILQTKIITENNQGYQLVCNEDKIKIDLGKIPSDQLSSHDKIINYVINETQKPFNLDSDLLFRADYYSIKESESILALSFHHIILDHPSIKIVYNELIKIYQAKKNNKEVELTEIELTYADYTNWQLSLTKNNLEPLLFYWKFKLGKKVKPLELPTDRPRPAIHTYTAAHYNFQLEKQLKNYISGFSQAQNVNILTVLLAAFKVMLFRYSGQEEIVVGTSSEGRYNKNIENLVGPIANLLVLKSNLSNNPSFTEFLRQLMNTVEGAFNQGMPFDKLVLELKPGKDMSRTALFDILFRYEENPIEDNSVNGTEIKVIETNKGYGKYDINLLIQNGDNGLSGVAVYNADIYDHFTIEQMMNHFCRILDEIISNPESKVRNFKLLTADEERKQLDMWNSTQVSYPLNKTIHEIFEDQAEKTPGNFAVSLGEEHLTYRQLNQKSNQLAYYLKERGVNTETLVGLYLEKSLDMIVAILAVLKAGGAYLPMDTEQPSDRLNYIVNDAKLSLVITDKSGSINLKGIEATIVNLDIENEKISQLPETNPKNNIFPNNLAYCLYTSGSTGKPKGVLVEHRNVVRLLINDKLQFKFTEKDVWTMFHSYFFDFSVWEIYGALFYGGEVVLIPKQVSRDPELFLNVLVDKKVTILNQTPTAFYNLINAIIEKPDVEIRLKYVIFGGEALDPTQLKRWKTTYPDTKLVNMYGITETTVHVTYKEITDKEINSNFSNLGIPIPTTNTYIMDENLRLLPIGVPGEICVGGDGVSRGYLRREELTKEKFVPNPYNPKERIYRSGDLAKLLPNGELIYLGRIDNQVQLHGFRIELGEIQYHLLQHPSVQDVCVIVREDNPGDKRLVAYVVMKDNEKVSTTEFRRFLKDNLLEYMIPSIFIILKYLPLTPNGKIDRKSLPAPDTERPELGETFVAPRTETEKILTEIWSQVLGIEKIGIRDNFFELGGDSILSIQIIARANQAGFKLTLKQIFQYQTIEELAGTASVSKMDSNEQGPVVGSVLLNAVQHWFFEIENPEPHHWNLSMLMDVTGVIDHEKMKNVIQKLLEHHDALRLRFSPTPSGWKQINTSPDSEIPYSIIDLSMISDKEKAVQIEIEKLHKSLNFIEGPLLRAAYLKLGTKRGDKLIIVIHHLVVDSISLSIINEDIILAYNQLNENSRINLPPKTTSFKKAMEKLSDNSTSEELKSEQNYWLNLFSHDIVKLPRDLNEGDNYEETTSSIRASLNEEETKKLFQSVPKTYNTQINDILLSALSISMQGWIGGKPLLINMEGHGREEIFEDIDISRTVGWFTSIFPVVLHTGNTSDLGNIIKLVKEMLRNIPNKGLGFGLLKYLSNDKDIVQKFRTFPEPEIIFNYLGNLSGISTESQTFIAIPEFPGPLHSPKAKRKHLIEINGWVAAGKLYVDWVYSNKIHLSATIEKLAQSYIATLRSIIEHCENPDAGGFTPSDFSEADLNPEELDKLLLKYTESNKENK